MAKFRATNVPTEEQAACAEAWREDMIRLNYQVRQFPEFIYILRQHVPRIIIRHKEFISTLVPRFGVKIAYEAENIFTTRIFLDFELNAGEEYLLPLRHESGYRYRFRCNRSNAADTAILHIMTRDNLSKTAVIPMRPGRVVNLLPYRSSRIVAMIPKDVHADDFVVLCKSDQVPRTEVTIADKTKACVLRLQVGIKAEITVPPDTTENSTAIKIEHDPNLDGTDQLHELIMEPVPSKTKVTVHHDIENIRSEAQYWAEDFDSRDYVVSDFPEVEEHIGSTEPTKMATSEHHFYSVTVPANGLRLFGSAKDDITKTIKEVGQAYIIGGRCYMVAIKFDERITVFYKTPPKNRAVLYVVAYKRWDWNDEEYDQTQQTISDRITMRMDREVIFLCVPNRITQFAMLPANDEGEEFDDVTSVLDLYSKYGHLNTNFQRSLISLSIRSILSVKATRGGTSDGMPWIRFRSLAAYSGFRNVADDDELLLEPEILILSKVKEEHEMDENPDEPPEKKQKTGDENLMDTNEEEVTNVGEEDNEFGDDGWSL